MFIHLFGKYLLDKNLITQEQLDSVIDYVKTAHSKVGMLAINKGYMSSTEVFEVHDLQAKMDKKFGELAINLGYMTEEQLYEILELQKKESSVESNELVFSKYLSPNKLKKHLGKFKKDYNLTDDQLMLLRSNDTDEIVNIYCDFSASSDNNLYKKYTSLLLRNFIRFIDEEDILITSCSPLEDYTFDWIVYQNFLDRINIFTGIATKKDNFNNLPSQYTSNDLSTIDEFTQLSIKDLLVVQNNTFIRHLKDNSINVETSNLSTKTNAILLNTTSGYKISMHTFWGDFDVIIAPSDIRVE